MPATQSLDVCRQKKEVRAAIRISSNTKVGITAKYTLLVLCSTTAIAIFHF